MLCYVTTYIQPHNTYIHPQLVIKHYPCSPPVNTLREHG